MRAVLALLPLLAPAAGLRQARGASPLLLDSTRIPGADADVLGPFARYTPPDYQGHARAPAGREHYRLIQSLAAQLGPGDTVADVGTRYGTSAFALALPGAARVESFDVPESRELEQSLQRLHAKPGTAEALTSGRLFPNLRFHKAHLLEDEEAFGRVLGSRLVVLDTLHRPETQPFEYAFIDKLASRGFKGVLVLDDIGLNDEMRRLWSRMCGRTDARALNATALGHWSGTGILDFSGDVLLSA